ncbi:GAF domain-containing protein [Variovorax sp. HJSM1_2]|uniref:GAF domain-containing protein n=1 Tax=Variovorax sp. HJSM1_2 TaxID=3366263 RepID=UPI003BE522A0
MAFEVQFPDVALAVQNVIANQRLNERSARQPDYAAQVAATTTVVKALAETPDSVLAKLSQGVLQLTGADSAGVSLFGRANGNRVFLWQAAVGLFEKYLGAVVPYEESPCGLVISTDKTMLMLNPGEAYKTAAQVQPPIEEVLLVPFHVNGQAVGTVWAISQGHKKFDAEDARLITDMSELAALAYHVLTKMGDLELLNKAVQLVAEEQLQFPLAAAVRPVTDQRTVETITD